jgi:hypothetical protein
VIFSLETLELRFAPSAIIYLAERGGIQFDYGLDEGEPGTTTIATGLGDKLFSELFARYAVKGVLFTSDGKNVTIQITG